MSQLRQAPPTQVRRQPPKPTCRVGTVAPLPAYTVSGITLTAVGNGALVVDGLSVVVTDRVAVLNSGTATAADRGIYEVVATGGPAAAWKLVRAPDMDTSDEVLPNINFWISSGTLADSQWVLTTDAPIVLGTTALNFAATVPPGGGAAPLGAAYLVQALHGDLPSERVLTAPAAGITLTDSGPGNPLAIGLADDLAGIEGLGTFGIGVRTALSAWATRSLVAPLAGLAIANPAGLLGDPTFSLANDLAAVEALTGTGLAVHSGTDTWVTRAIVGTANRVLVTNGDGVAGAPTLSTPQDIHTGAAFQVAQLGVGGAALGDGVTVMSAASPQIMWRETDQVLPSGAWRWMLEGNFFRIDRNTAADGLFGTFVRVFGVSSSGAFVDSTAPTVPGSASHWMTLTSTVQGPTTRNVNLQNRGEALADRYYLDVLDTVGDVHNTLAVVAGTSSVFNERGLDIDFRVEGDNDPNLIVTDAFNDRVGIGGVPGAFKLDVFGVIRATQVNTGDLVMHSPDGTAKWRLVEEPDRIVALNELTGRRYAITLTPLEAPP